MVLAVCGSVSVSGNQESAIPAMSHLAQVVPIRLSSSDRDFPSAPVRCRASHTERSMRRNDRPCGMGYTDTRDSLNVRLDGPDGLPHHVGNRRSGGRKRLVVGAGREPHRSRPRRDRIWPAVALDLDTSPDRPATVTPGQQRLILAAFEADLGPAAIAKEFRVSRSAVQHAITDAKRDRRSRERQMVEGHRRPNMPWKLTARASTAMTGASALPAGHRWRSRPFLAFRRHGLHRTGCRHETGRYMSEGWRVEHFNKSRTALKLCL